LSPSRECAEAFVPFVYHQADLYHHQWNPGQSPSLEVDLACRVNNR